MLYVFEGGSQPRQRLVQSTRFIKVLHVASELGFIVGAGERRHTQYLSVTIEIEQLNHSYTLHTTNIISSSAYSPTTRTSSSQVVHFATSWISHRPAKLMNPIWPGAQSPAPVSRRKGQFKETCRSSTGEELVLCYTSLSSPNSH